MEKTIIAIDPGTRYWGVAIFQGRDLVVPMVKTFTEKGSVQHRSKVAKMTFLSLFDKYVPDILVIEKPFPFWSKQSKFLNGIIEAIKDSAENQGMKVREYSPKTARKAVCNNENAGKREAAEKICSMYSELKGYLNQDTRGKDNYWGYMFESMGLVVCYLKKYEKISI